MGRVSNFHLGRGTSGSPQISIYQGMHSSKVDSHRHNHKPVNATGEALKSRVSDTKLKGVINELYRPGATTAALLREKQTGELVCERFHEKKAKERLSQLKKMEEKNNYQGEEKNNYQGEEKKVVNKLIKDLEEAIDTMESKELNELLVSKFPELKERYKEALEFNDGDV